MARKIQQKDPTSLLLAGLALILVMMAVAVLFAYNLGRYSIEKDNHVIPKNYAAIWFTFNDDQSMSKAIVVLDTDKPAHKDILLYAQQHFKDD